MTQENKLQKQLNTIADCLTTMIHNAALRKSDDLKDTNERIEELTRAVEGIYFYLVMKMEGEEKK